MLILLVVDTSSSVVYHEVRLQLLLTRSNFQKKLDKLDKVDPINHMGRVGLVYWMGSIIRANVTDKNIIVIIWCGGCVIIILRGYNTKSIFVNSTNILSLYYGW